MKRCPVPECDGVVADGGVFCSDHHLRLKPNDRRLIYQLRFKASRTYDAEMRQFLNEQVDGYIAAGVRHVTQEQKL